MPQQPQIQKPQVNPWDAEWVAQQQPQITAPPLGLLQQLFGPSFMQPKLKQDISLPMPPGGQIDPRLETGTSQRQDYLKSRGTQLENIQEGLAILRNLGKK